MNQNTAILRCCPICSPFCDEEFKQVINLKKSGLSIYVHHNKNSVQQRNFERKRSIILCNSGHKELKRFDYIAELCQYKTKCFKCQALIQHIRSLLENLTTINENEIIAICEYCKRSPKMNKCKRCEYLTYKFLNIEAERYLENKIRYNELISNVRQVLLSLMQSQIICKHNVYIDSESKMQIQKLLKHLNWPVTLRQPNIDFLLNIVEKQKKENSFTSKISKDSHYDTSLKVTSKNCNESIMDNELSLFETGSSCVCKYILKDKVREQASFRKTETEDLSYNSLKPKINETNVTKTSISSRVSSDSTIKSLLPKRSNKLKENPSKKYLGKEKYNINNKNNVVTKNKKEKYKLSETTENKSKQFPEPCIDSIVKLVKQGKKVKDNIKKYHQKEKTEECSKILDSAAVDELKEHKEILLERSESVLECIGGNSMNISERIKGTKIVPSSRHVTGHNFKKLPLFYHIQHNLDLLTLSDHKSFSLNSEYNKDQPQAKESGIFLYKLSDRNFIDKGWTKLPTTKIMRRMNIYKMIPSYTEFDWFENHKEAKTLFYDSNKKLAEIYENGCGKWFYENGNLALEYYSAPGLYSNKRCIIYGSKRDIYLKKKNSVNIMACFDYLGNGIVFDNDGNVRLKYNQCEGLVIDKKIGPPGRWKWHKLNEPPVLYPVLIDTFVKDKLSKNDIKYKEYSTKDDMIANIEMNNLQREQASKMVQKYQSFQIRIKVVKINEYFTLKIIKQSRIYLQFRYEHVCLKLNLGMLLKNKEIVDVNVAEVSEVSTPLDDLNKKTIKTLFDN